VTIIGKQQVSSLSHVIQAFTWPSKEAPCVDLIDSSLDMLVVDLLGADKEEEESILRFCIDEDGGLWLVSEWTQAMIDAGEWPDIWPARLVDSESFVDGSTYRASIRPFSDSSRCELCGSTHDVIAATAMGIDGYANPRNTYMVCLECGTEPGDEGGDLIAFPRPDQVTR
jgi:hypothetical protein